MVLKSIGTSFKCYEVQNLKSSEHSVFILMFYVLVELLFRRNVVLKLFCLKHCCVCIKLAVVLAFCLLGEETKTCLQMPLHKCFSNVLCCLVFIDYKKINF